MGPEEQAQGWLDAPNQGERGTWRLHFQTCYNRQLVYDKRNSEHPAPDQANHVF